MTGLPFGNYFRTKVVQPFRNKAGIIDPTKVVRIALDNAVSVGGTLLLTEATMTEVEEKPKSFREEAALEDGMLE